MLKETSSARAMSSSVDVAAEELVETAGCPAGVGRAQQPGRGGCDQAFEEVLGVAVGEAFLVGPPAFGAFCGDVPPQ